MESHCRNCLFDTFNKDQFEQNIQDYIKSLSPDEKTGERLYQIRLKLCSECSDCIEDLCRICGCFVRARAAKKKAVCPAVCPKW